MANKKEVAEAVNHDTLMSRIEEAEKELLTARNEYKEFCKDNPLNLKPQPTNHELRMLREKNSKASLEDHQKSNKAAASNAQKEQLKQELKGA